MSKGGTQDETGNHSLYNLSVTILIDAVEARVLGSLMEKEATTPDYYPQSLNALVNACNQKNNRDPVMTLDEASVRQALESVNADYRAILILRDIDDLDYEAIAETLAISLPAVKSRLHRARKELANLLKEKD